MSTSTGTAYPASKLHHASLPTLSGISPPCCSPTRGRAASRLRGRARAPVRRGGEGWEPALTGSRDSRPSSPRAVLAQHRSISPSEFWVGRGNKNPRCAEHEVLEVDILWPRWVARIGVTRSTQACFLTADRQCTELPLLRLPRLVHEFRGSDPKVGLLLLQGRRLSRQKRAERALRP